MAVSATARAGGVAQTDKLYTRQQIEPGDAALGLYNYKARFYSTVLRLPAMHGFSEQGMTAAADEIDLLAVGGEGERGDGAALGDAAEQRPPPSICAPTRDPFRNG